MGGCGLMRVYINQRDLREKGEQVLKMGDIFSKGHGACYLAGAGGG